MGPSLARLALRANEAAGTLRRIIAVSRFSDSAARADLELDGIETIACDLLNRDEVAELPNCPNVIFLAGRKFGSAGRPDLTWAMNALVPANVAERFAASRIVVFSSGNVYPFRRLAEGGCTEDVPPDPVGEYAQSCLARERVFEYYSRERGTPCLLYRLNYAVDLRYGVPVDIARRVYVGEPVDVSVPAFNAIWQRDAVSYALRSLELCDSPPRILNATGAEMADVSTCAEYFAQRFGRGHCSFAGRPGSTALLSDASCCFSLLGPPSMGLAELLGRVADWIEDGGASLGKPTHFEVADGRF